MRRSRVIHGGIPGVLRAARGEGLGIPGVK